MYSHPTTSSRPLLPQGGTNRNRKAGQQLSPQGAMNVHAALNQWVRVCCTKAGVPAFNLRDDSGYEALYMDYTKDRNHKRKTLVPVNFTLDHYVKVMHHLYSCGDVDAPRTRALVAMAVSAVARGDEVRGVRVKGLALEHIDSIGEHCRGH